MGRRGLVVVVLAAAMIATGCLPKIADYAGTTGNGRPAVSTPIAGAQTVLAVGDGQALFGETNFLRRERVRSIDLSTGLLAPHAGTGHWGVLGDGGGAVDAHLFGPAGMDRDSAGNLYVAESKSSRVRKVAPDGTISTFAGRALTQSQFMAGFGIFDYGGFGGDGLAATAALLDTPTDVAVDNADNVYIADGGNARVRRVSASDGTIDTVVGGGGLAPANGLAGEQIGVEPLGLALDPAGDLVITTGSNQILRWDPDADIVTVIGGTGTVGFSGDGGLATAATFGLDQHPIGNTQGYVTAGVDVKADGTVLVADTGNRRVRAISPAGIVTTVAGGGASPPPGVATLRSLTAPSDVSVAPDGSVLISDFTTVLTLEPDTFLGVVAGTGDLAPPYGDGGQVSDATLILPFGLDFATDGTAYFTEQSRWLRSISPSGVVDTIAEIDSDAGRDAIALSGDGTMWVASQGASEPVIEVSLTTGAVVRTLSVSGSDLAVDPVTKTLYVADQQRVWQVNPTTGAATVYAGTGSSSGPLGDGGPATSATLQMAAGLAVHPATRDLYIADQMANRVRRVDRTTNVITTFAGTGVPAHTGDGGPASAAGLRVPFDLAFSGTGVLYILEAPTGLVFIGGNNGGQIRAVYATGYIYTYAGDGGPSGTSAPGAFAGQSRLGNAYQIDVHPLSDELYVADTGSHRILQFVPPPPPE